jgi:hypothetical protein
MQDFDMRLFSESPTLYAFSVKQGYEREVPRALHALTRGNGLALPTAAYDEGQFSRDPNFHFLTWSALVC